MKDLVGLEFTPAQFEELRLLCKGDALFPVTRGAWTDMLLAATAEAIKSGRSISLLPLDPKRFESWCARVGIIPCLDALRAYAIVQRSTVASAHYGTIDLDSRPVDLSGRSSG